MAPTTTLFTAAYLLASLVAATPIGPSPHSYTLDEARAAVDEYEKTYSRGVQGIAAPSACTGEKCSCSGQSCVVADLAGSSGRKATQQPQGGGNKDYKCIAKYNPAGIEQVKSAPKVNKQDVGVSSAMLSAMNTIQGLTAGKTDKGSFNAACRPNILIFAKGTTEVGPLGITVGPVLSAGLKGMQWQVAGVNYDADVPGDYCLGLPGGMVARDMINQAASKCSSSKIFVSGYSQGAMVARNGVAYADASAKAKVAGVVTFGDPFQGSSIKGYSGPIMTWCNNGDGVCTGNFELAGSHLSYVGGASTKAIAAMKKLASQSLPSGGSKGDAEEAVESAEEPAAGKGKLGGLLKGKKGSLRIRR